MLEKIFLLCPESVAQSAHALSSRVATSISKTVNAGDVATAKQRRSEAVALIQDLRHKMSADLSAADYVYSGGATRERLSTVENDAVTGTPPIAKR